jgi:hypothetical protein
MNTTSRKGIAAFAAAGAFFAFAACGAEITPQPNKIGDTQEQHDEPSTPQSPRTTVPHTRFGDEYGVPSIQPTPKEKIDRTQDWH